MAVVVLVSGCATRRPSAQAASSIPAVKKGQGGDYLEIQKVAFRPGLSSVTVERLAKQYGCDGSAGAGAGLMTEAGPVEVYRMQCGAGKTFMARCELRQCQALPAASGAQVAVEHNPDGAR